MDGGTGGAHGRGPLTRRARPDPSPSVLETHPVPRPHPNGNRYCAHGCPKGRHPTTHRTQGRTSLSGPGRTAPRWTAPSCRFPTSRETAYWEGSRVLPITTDPTD